MKFLFAIGLKGPDERLVAKRVHALGPQVPSGHVAWDSIPIR